MVEMILCAGAQAVSKDQLSQIPVAAPAVTNRSFGHLQEADPSTSCEWQLVCSGMNGADKADRRF
jgi:hypothetical protein